MVISVFSKPKLHKILPPLVWDKEMLKQPHTPCQRLADMRVNTHTDPELLVCQLSCFGLNLQLQKMYAVKEPTNGFCIVL